MTNNEISKLLGVQWAALSLADKLPYQTEAKKLKEEHKKNNPDFKSGPKQDTKRIKEMDAVYLEMCGRELIHELPDQVDWQKLAKIILHREQNPGTQKETSAAGKKRRKLSKAAREAVATAADPYVEEIEEIENSFGFNART